MFWAWSERVMEWWIMRVVMMTEMSWQVNEEVSRDMTGEADGMNQGVDSRDGVMHNLNERFVIFNEEMVGGRERVRTDEERVLRGGWTEIRLLRQLGLLVTWVTAHADLSLCTIKCCSVVLDVTLRFLVINISSSFPAINKLRHLLPAISVTTCRGPAAPCW